MKRKNLKGVINNFAHSLQSFDFTHSSKVVFDILTDVYCKTGKSEITFDFVRNEISPESMNTEDARIIFNDYIEWLPKLSESHNTDSNEIEELQIRMEVDFSHHKHPKGMIGVVELEMKTAVEFKIKERKNEQISFSEIDLYGEKIMPQKLKDKYWDSKEQNEINGKKEFRKKTIIEEIFIGIFGLFLGDLTSKTGWALLSLIMGIVVIIRPIISESGIVQKKTFIPYILGSCLIILSIGLIFSWINKRNATNSK